MLNLRRNGAALQLVEVHGADLNGGAAGKALFGHFPVVGVVEHLVLAWLVQEREAQE